MAAITFASKLGDDGSLAMPREAVDELGIHPGDVVRVRVEATNGADHMDESDQAELQARFERLLDELDTLTFEKPARFPNGDQVEAAFTEIMDEKYRELGFKS